MEMLWVVDDWLNRCRANVVTSQYAWVVFGVVHELEDIVDVAKSTDGFDFDIDNKLVWV